MPLVKPKLVYNVAFVEIHSQTLQTRFQASSNFSPISSDLLSFL